MSLFGGDETRLDCGCADCDPWRYETDYLEFVSEDAATLPELIETLRKCADYYEDRHRLGWRLIQPVQNGMVELQKDD